MSGLVFKANGKLQAWDASGHVVSYHRTTLLNHVAAKCGREGFNEAAAMIGPAEYVTALNAQHILSVVSFNL